MLLSVSFSNVCWVCFGNELHWPVSLFLNLIFSYEVCKWVQKSLSHCNVIFPVIVIHMYNLFQSGLYLWKRICGCSPGSLRVKPAKAVAVVTMNGEDVKNFDFVPFEKKLKKISIPTCFISRVLGLPERRYTFKLLFIIMKSARLLSNVCHITRNPWPKWLNLHNSGCVFPFCRTIWSQHAWIGLWFTPSQLECWTGRPY